MGYWLQLLSDPSLARIRRLFPYEFLRAPLNSNNNLIKKSVDSSFIFVL